MRLNRRYLALFIWLAFGLVCLIGEYAHAERAGSQNPRPVPPGLAKVMAEGAGRVANMTCDDVRAVVALYGVRRAEAVARASGATDSQIREAKRCLSSSSR